MPWNLKTITYLDIWTSNSNKTPTKSKRNRARSRLFISDQRLKGKHILANRNISLYDFHKYTSSYDRLWTTFGSTPRYMVNFHLLYLLVVRKTVRDSRRIHTSIFQAGGRTLSSPERPPCPENTKSPSASPTENKRSCKSKIHKRENKITKKEEKYRL